MVRLTINGKVHDIDADPGTPLANVREKVCFALRQGRLGTACSVDLDRDRPHVGND